MYFRKSSTSALTSSALGDKFSLSSLRKAVCFPTSILSWGYSLRCSRSFFASSIRARRIFVIISGEIRIFPVFFSPLGIVGANFFAKLCVSKTNSTSVAASGEDSISITLWILILSEIGRLSIFSSVSAISIAFLDISSTLPARNFSKESIYQSYAAPSSMQHIFSLCFPPKALYDILAEPIITRFRPSLAFNK